MKCKFFKYRKNNKRSSNNCRTCLGRTVFKHELAIYHTNSPSLVTPSADANQAAVDLNGNTYRCTH